MGNRSEEFPLPALILNSSKVQEIIPHTLTVIGGAVYMCVCVCVCARACVVANAVAGL